MALRVMVIPPNKTSYSVEDGNEVLSVALDGGASRFRKDILRSASRVVVAWSVGPEDYKYIRAFYRTGVNSGADVFLIDLVLDDSDLVQHKAHFVPNTMRLESHSGLTFNVSATLEVETLAPDEAADNALLDQYELDYGV